MTKTMVGMPDPTAGGPNWAPIFTVNTNTLAVVVPRWKTAERRAAS